MKDFTKTIVYALIILVLVSGVYALVSDSLKPQKEISLSELVQKINAGEVKNISIQDSDLQVTLKDDSQVHSRKEANAGLVQVLKDYGVDQKRKRERIFGDKRNGHK